MSAKLLVAGVAGGAVVILAVIVATTSHDPVSSGDPRSAARSASPSAMPAGGRSASPSVSASPSASAAPTPAASSVAPVSLEIHVPRASSAIVPDGEVEEPAWQGKLGRTGAFLAPDGSQARPYSDARFLYGDGKLHVVLYAADEDIHTMKVGASPGQYDAFHMVFDDGKLVRTLDVTPLGTLVEASRPAASTAPPGPWKSGAKLGHDLDGTPDDPKDQDEEWVIEMDIPLASLGLDGKPGERIGFSIERCDTPKASPRVCASFGSPKLGSLVLE